MKKIFALILVLCLFAGVPAFADGLTEADFMGTWVNIYDNNSGGAVMEFFHIREDHRVFYLNRRFEKDDPGFGRQYVGSWDVRGNVIHLKYGDNTETDVYMSDGFLMVPLGGDQYVPFGRVPVWGKDAGATPAAAPDPTPEPTQAVQGVAIPQGEYSIGIDIPAGKYVIDAGPAKRVTVWTYDAEQWVDCYYIGSEENEQTMIVNLEEGGRLRIERATVYLRPFKGFDFEIFK